MLIALASGCAVAPVLPPRNNTTAEKVVVLARSLCGTPYRYGGTTPQGFDCSGFVQFVYRQAAGVQLARTSKGQFDETVAVHLGQEAPGDMVFYDIEGSGPSHVGIYVGQGWFVHAPRSGGVVKISNANDAYWRSHFLGVRRVW